MPKSARLSGIKSLRCYTIQEAAEVTGISTRSIRAWIKQGLPVLASERPILIRGDDLGEFIKKQRAGRKTEVPLHDFYCLRCRQASAAAGGFATLSTNGKRASLKAICAECEGVMNKSVAVSRLPEVRRKLELISDD